jgi:hypothetical protein
MINKINNTLIVQCQYCNRKFLVPLEEWRQGEEYNCICGIWNGTVKIGRFKGIKEIYVNDKRRK